MGHKATAPSNNIAQLRRFIQRSSILDTVASPFYSGRNYNPFLKTLQLVLYHLQLDQSLQPMTFGTYIPLTYRCSHWSSTICFESIGTTAARKPLSYHFPINPSRDMLIPRSAQGSHTLSSLYTDILRNIRSSLTMGSKSTLTSSCTPPISLSTT